MQPKLYAYTSATLDAAQTLWLYTLRLIPDACTYMLTSIAGVARVYVLARGKGSASAQQRIERWVYSNNININIDININKKVVMIVRADIDISLRTYPGIAGTG